MLFITADPASEVEAGINQQIFAVAGGEKQIWIVPEAIHTAGFTVAPTEYIRRIMASFDNALLR